MRILLIEDEHELAAEISAGLALEGFEVDHSDNGPDGLWRAQEFDYDAIVLDLLLPGMNGYKVCTTLRSGGSAVPVLMLTAKAGDYDQVEGLEAGADDFLTKPVSQIVLGARLKALLRRARGFDADGVLRCGDLELDPVRRRCHLGASEVHLTAREFELAEVFMAHPNQVLTRSALRDAVWGPEFVGDSNVVDVYVGYLRRKVDGDGPSQIETIRGVGYRLLAPS